MCFKLCSRSKMDLTWLVDNLFWLSGIICSEKEIRNAVNENKNSMCKLLAPFKTRYFLLLNAFLISSNASKRLREHKVNRRYCVFMYCCSEETHLGVHSEICGQQQGQIFFFQRLWHTTRQSEHLKKSSCLIHQASLPHSVLLPSFLSFSKRLWFLW